MVTRRRVLVGVAGTVAVGAVGGVGTALGWQRVGERLGVVDPPDHDPPHSGVEVVRSSFRSGAMGADVGWARSRPPGAVEAVVLCLHGRGNDHRMAFDSIRMHDMVAEADAPLAVVSVDGGDNTYWHPRSDGADPRRMLVDELLPRVAESVGADLPVVALGWSMGGYGSLLLASTRPDLVRGVCAASPALFASFASSTAGSFDDDDDFRRHDVRRTVDRLDGVDLRVDCGAQDVFVDEARRFAERVEAVLGRAPEGGFGHGAHNHGYWRSLVPDQLRSIERWRRSW